MTFLDLIKVTDFLCSANKEKKKKWKFQILSASGKDGWMDGYLLGHLDDDVGIAATDVTNGEINAASDADSEKTEQILHERGCRL